MRIPFVSSAVTWIQNKTPEVVKQGVTKVTQVAAGIIGRSAPYVVPTFIWHISRIPGLRIISTGGFISYFSLNLAEALFSRKTDFRTCLHVAAGAIGIMDNSGLLPISKTSRVAMDCLLLLVAGMGSAEAFYEGMTYLEKGLTREARASEKIADVATGALLLGLASTNGFLLYNTSKQLMQGLDVFNGLDPAQQQAVVKFRSLQTLATPKSCRAVVIDGSRPTSGHSVGAIETLYDNCRTQTFRIHSGEAFCQVLNQTSQLFKKSIDILFLFSPSNSTGQILNPNYVFKADPSDPAIACINEFLNPDGQIVLFSQATAYKYDKISFAKALSQLTGFKKVVGFVGGLHSHMTLQSFKNRTLKIHAFDFNFRYLTRTFHPSLI